MPAITNYKQIVLGNSLFGDTKEFVEWGGEEERKKKRKIDIIYFESILLTEPASVLLVSKNTTMG